MVKEIKDGDIIDNLEVLFEGDRDEHGRRMKMCLCLLCGNEKQIKTTYLRTGKATSCGCDHSKKISKSKMKHGGASERTKEYQAWQGMRGRCTNKNYHAYHRYGGRGITYCERWNDFSNFLEDMGEAPTQSHQLDRIDNDGNYEPSNCRWVTPKENSNNRGKQGSKSGYTGIFKRKERYLVSFTFNRKNIYVGSYGTLEEAVEARKQSIIKFNKENNENLKYEEFIK